MTRFTPKNLSSLEPSRPAIELAAFLTLATVDLWLLHSRPLLSLLARAGAVLILVASYRRRRLPSRRRPAAARRAWLEAAAATLLLAVLVLAWAAAVREPYDEPDFAFLELPGPLLGPWIMRRLGLAAVQQLALQLFLWPVLRELSRSSAAASVAASAVFGLLHLPSPAFALTTALCAAVWLALYRRCRRLAPLILSHALLVTVAHVVPERLFYDREVGARATARVADYRLLADHDSRALLRTVTSERYTAHRGTERGYVEGLYRDLLGRPAAEHETRAWVERLRQSSPAAVAKQMLLSPELDAASLGDRAIDYQLLKPGVAILPASPSAEFGGWHDAEPGWRWARTRAPAIRFGCEHDPGRLHVLALDCAAATEQQVELELDGHTVGHTVFSDLAPQSRRFLLAPEQLAVGESHELRLHLSGERIAIGADTRRLGLGFRSLKLAPLRFPSVSVAFPDDLYFLEGFSVAEEGLRWTDGPVARLAYPLRRIEPGVYELRLTAGAFGRQKVEIRLNGSALAHWTFEDLRPRTRSVHFGAGLLRPGANELELRLPDAERPEGDPRRLGLAFVTVRIGPLRRQ